MTTLEFEDLRFREGGNGGVSVEFLGNYGFEVTQEMLRSLGAYELEETGRSIAFSGISDKEARDGFSEILNYGLARLKNLTTGKKTLYVHKYSGIPLIGTASFGIIDRNTSIIEVRPLSGCNMNCIFCSVDEGLASKKTSEVVVEEEYLAEGVKRLAEFKQCDCQAIINSQGEPTLYKRLPQLVRHLKTSSRIKWVSLVTNGTLLTPELVDRLESAGLDTLNVSLNAIEPKKARILEGYGRYDVEKVKEMTAYAASKMKVVIAPVIVTGYNDAGEMDELVRFAKETGTGIGMQNYLAYRKGRNPKGVQQIPWEEFYEKLERLEERHGMKLIYSSEDYGITKTKALPKPFRKGNVIRATVVSGGRYPGEYLAAAKNRIITLPNCKMLHEGGEKVRVRILSDKHNIFYGKEL